MESQVPVVSHFHGSGC